MDDFVPHVVFVVGVHRSGTSAVTRAINLLGADLGGKLIEAQQGVNDLGFWESQDVVDLNEKILSSLGGSWYDFRLIDKSVFQKKYIQIYVERAKAILQKNFSGKKITVIKDPRFCRLYPVWKQAVEELNWNRSVVLVTRNPLEVVESLSKRDGFSKGVSALLWTTYTFSMLMLTSGEKRLSLDYDFFMKHPHEALKKLKEYVPEFQEPDKVIHVVKEEIQSGFRHYNYQLNQDDIDEVFGVMWELHELACETSTEEVPDGFMHLFNSYKEYLQRTPALNDDLYDTLDLLVKCQQKTMIIGEQHSHAQSVVNQRDEQLAKHQEKIAVLQDELANQKVHMREQSGKLTLIREKFLTAQNEMKKEGIDSAFMGNELLSESQRQITILEGELLKKKEASEESSRSLNELEAKFNIISRENSRLQIEKDELDEQIDTIKEESHLLHLDNKELKVLVSSNKEKQYLLEGQIRQMLIAFNEAKQNELLKDSLLEEKDKELLIKEEKIEEAIKERDTQKKLLEDEIKLLTDDFADMMRKNEILEDTLDEKKQSLSKLRQHFKEHEEEMDLLKQRYKALKEKFLVKLLYAKQ